MSNAASDLAKINDINNSINKINNKIEEDTNKKLEKTDNISNSTSSDEYEKEKRKKILLNNQTTLPEEKSYTSRLVTSIPIKISMEFDRKATVKSIIDAVKNMDELELEKTSYYTNLILIGYNLNFIDTDNKIDECFQNNQTVDIYEFLNFNGLNEIVWKPKNNLEYLKNIENVNSNSSTNASEFESANVDLNKNVLLNNNNSSKNIERNYQNLIIYGKENQKKNNEEDELLPISYDTLKVFRMPILDYNMENKEKKFEYLVEINHRFVIEKEYYLFNQGTFKMHNFFFDAMLLNNSVKNFE